MFALTKVLGLSRSIARECGKETVLSLIKSRPDLILVGPGGRQPPARDGNTSVEVPGAGISSDSECLKVSRLVEKSNMGQPIPNPLVNHSPVCCGLL